jgi:DNA-binding CsgD family transcriptional regulator
MAAGKLTLGGVYLELLAIEQARMHVEEALTLAQEVNSHIFIQLAKTVLALSYLETNETDRAEELLESIGTSDPVGYYDYFSWSVRARLALQRNDPALVLQLIERCRPQFFEQSNWIAIALRQAQGEALAALGDPAAENVLRSACEMARRRGIRPMLWHCQIELGKVLLSKKRIAEAEAELARASAVIEESAAAVPDEELRANFCQRALGLIPALGMPTPRQAAKRAYDGLTEAEQQVAALVAQGKSNREIAAAQVVSIKTTEAHISHILSKLGFTSRSQIAVWAVEKGLAMPRSGEGA